MNITQAIGTTLIGVYGIALPLIGLGYFLINRGWFSFRAIAVCVTIAVLLIKGGI